MTIFKKLHDLIHGRSQEPTPNPGGLKDSQMSALRALRSHDSWSDYLSVLDTAINLNAEAMLGARANEDVHFYRGLITGLRRAGTLVDEILEKEQQLAAHRAATGSRAAAADPEQRRRLATYGTPFWRGSA